MKIWCPITNWYTGSSMQKRLKRLLITLKSAILGHKGMEKLERSAPESRFRRNWEHNP